MLACEILSSPRAPPHRHTNNIPEHHPWSDCDIGTLTHPHTRTIIFCLYSTTVLVPPCYRVRDLHSNRLSGNIPASLGNATNLFYMYVWSSSRTGWEWIGRRNAEPGTRKFRHSRVPHLAIFLLPSTHCIPKQEYRAVPRICLASRFTPRTFLTEI